MKQVNNNLLLKIALFFVGLRFFAPNSRTSKSFFYLWMLIWGGNTLNIGILFITNVLKKNYSEIPENFAYLVGHSGTALGCILFGLHNKEWKELFEFLLGPYQPFGKSSQFEKLKALGNFLGKVLLTYISSGLVVYTTFEILDENECEKRYNGAKMCGVLNPTWVPSQIHLTVLEKRFILVYQMMSSFFMACIVFTIFLTYHASLLIADRANGLCTLFDEMCLIPNPETQFQAFTNWVNYHEDTIRLCSRLNKVYKKTVGHITLLVAVTLAFLGYQLMRDSSLKCLVYISGYLLLIFVCCHSGQLLEDQMMKVGRAVYLSQWYHSSQEIREWIPFIILRSQQRIALDALPIGSANNILLLTVIKTTYSYLTLLQQTIER
ncbi:odorant receptor 67c-like [Euwallacea similis]|uniref:odorant receptor 67c-like n=1 Tax=Euwallacea similis TaxID=1736056 RepID=UPI00344C0AA5